MYSQLSGYQTQHSEEYALLVTENKASSLTVEKNISASTMCQKAVSTKWLHFLLEWMMESHLKIIIPSHED